MWNTQLILVAIINYVTGDTYSPKPDIGYPAGLIPHCPGVLKNATISNAMLPQLQVCFHQIINGIVTQRKVSVQNAARSAAKDKSIDLKNKKTILYAVGFLDSSIYLHSQAIGTAYAKRDYNVFITETQIFLLNIYPISVRLARTIGKKLGEFLVQLTEFGLEPENLELAGASLGAHIVSYAAKHFYLATGKKPSRITALDPAGPCFRSLPEEYRFTISDAERVDVVHTNIDGFGMAERLGHVDFYVNGGEFQPSDIPYIPCLIVCSHVRAIFYWWQALEHPKKFIGMTCDTIQDARLANCYNSTVYNYLGLETKFNRTGVYYLGTNNEFPYYRGKEGLRARSEIYTSIVSRINSDNGIVV